MPPSDCHYTVLAGTIIPKAFTALAAALLAQVQQQQPQPQSLASNSTPVVPTTITFKNPQDNSSDGVVKYP